MLNPVNLDVFDWSLDVILSAKLEVNERLAQSEGTFTDSYPIFDVLLYSYWNIFRDIFAEFAENMSIYYINPRK